METGTIYVTATKTSQTSQTSQTAHTLPRGDNFGGTTREQCRTSPILLMGDRAARQTPTKASETYKPTARIEPYLQITKTAALYICLRHVKVAQNPAKTTIPVPRNILFEHRTPITSKRQENPFRTGFLCGNGSILHELQYCGSRNFLSSCKCQPGLPTGTHFLMNINGRRPVRYQ